MPRNLNFVNHTSYIGWKEYVTSSENTNFCNICYVRFYVNRSVLKFHFELYFGCRRSRRIKSVIVDPGLYLEDKIDMFHVAQKREIPRAFRVFTGDYCFFSLVLDILCLMLRITKWLHLSNTQDGSFLLQDYQQQC